MIFLQQAFPIPELPPRHEASMMNAGSFLCIGLALSLGLLACRGPVEVNRRAKIEKVGGSENAAVGSPLPSPPVPPPAATEKAPENSAKKVAELPPVALAKPFPGDTYGCKEPYEQPWKCENFLLNNVGQGSFLSIQRPGARYLLSAPHGWYDAGTDAITYSIFPKDIPETYPVWSQLIAHSFRGNSPAQTQHNVNRPSTLTNDVCTNPANLATSAMVFAAYANHLQRLSPQPALYFEIHGQSEPGLEASLEVATERVTAAEATTIRKIFQEELQKAGITGVNVGIEPLDTIFFNAGQTKQCGAIDRVKPAPAVHAEIPRLMREGDEAQLKSARFFRAALTRLAQEVFPVGRAPVPSTSAFQRVSFESLP